MKSETINLYKTCKHDIKMIECFECLMDNANLGLSGEEEGLAVKQIMKEYKDRKGGE